MTRAISKELFFQKVGYKPHSAGQWKFHRSKARFRVPVCGRRYGKSTMAGRDMEPELFIPNRRYWIVGPTYDLGEKEFRVIWDDLIVGLKLGLDKRVKKSYNKRAGTMFIEFPWNTSVEVRSAEHPERLVGDSLDGVIMSEAAKHKRETWERFIRASLADRRGWATFPTTPEGHNWLYDLWMWGQNSDIPQFESWRFPSWENPIVYPGGRNDPEIKLIEQTTAWEWFLQEIGADFTAFVGKIYDEFDETTHVKKHEFNPAWPNYISFDWGFTKPLAAVEFQVDPWDNIYVWREHYLAYTPLPEHVRILKARPEPYGYHLDLAFGDAEDPEAAMYVSSNYVPCIADPMAKANWREGVDLVKMFMKMHDTGFFDQYGTPMRKPKFFIDPSCPNTIREHSGYRAPENQSSNVKEASTNSAAIKKDDHTCDALRYGLVHIFKLGATHHLAELAAVAKGDNAFVLTDNSPSSEGMFTAAGMRF
jgi:hypothetical protein